jgi:hypothetical protein
MEWGSAVDCLATTPDQFAKTVQFVDAASWVGKAAQEARQAIRAAGKVPMLSKDFDRVNEAAAMLAAHFERHGLDVAEKQVAMTMQWTGPSGRVYNIKCLMDFFKPLADLKTTASLDERDLSRTIRTYGYNWQGAIYGDCARANGVETEDVFPLHFQESSEPFRTRVWHLAPEDIEAGRKAYLDALNLWDRCITHDIWPGEEMPAIEGRKAIYE